VDRWNLYSDEYQHLNKMLKEISKQIANKFNGFAYPPTTETPAEQIENVKYYYHKTISHRLVAEYAGIGWRGKNELIITENRGPAVRFTSILINVPMIQGTKIESKCSNCAACLEVCQFLKYKEDLEDYRENCRKFIFTLGLKHDVCGKCIKACFRESIFKENFKSEL
jgi:epoxyqueuosine reductase QueG